MYFEVVLTTPKGRPRYHERMRVLPSRDIIFKSPDYPTSREANEAIEIVQRYSAGTPIDLIDESGA